MNGVDFTARAESNRASRADRRAFVRRYIAEHGEIHTSLLAKLTACTITTATSTLKGLEATGELVSAIRQDPGAKTGLGRRYYRFADRGAR